MLWAFTRTISMRFFLAPKTHVKITRPGSKTEHPGVVSLARSTFVEIDHEIISTVILLLIQEGLLSVTIESMCTKYWVDA